MEKLRYNNTKFFSNLLTVFQGDDALCQIAKKR